MVQWVKNLTAGAQVAAEAWAWSSVQCSGLRDPALLHLQRRSELWLGFNPWPGCSHMYVFLCWIGKPCKSQQIQCNSSYRKEIKKAKFYQALSCKSCCWSSFVVKQVKNLALSLQRFGFTVVAWVWSLAWELPHAAGAAKGKKKKHHPHNHPQTLTIPLALDGSRFCILIDQVVLDLFFSGFEEVIW